MTRLLWILCVGLATTVLMNPATAHAQAGKLVAQGRPMVTLGGGISNNVVTVGGSIGYFVIDGLLPGIRYNYTFQNSPDIDWRRQQHEFNIFVRYYIAKHERIYPFIAADTGYLRRITTGDDVENTRYNLFCVYGGLGVLFLMTPHFGIEIQGGARTYLNAPQALIDEPFEVSKLEWGLGFGFYP